MWHNALSNCKSYGAILASIQNNEENNFIVNAMTKDSWIGLNDIGEAGTRCAINFKVCSTYHVHAYMSY